ncbi:hypothetical protein CCHR01_06585 [Colletotrichum chrysophilum]|uniref:Uncharacterized protein n=1 Tax=Colletotrichum chrysophilum TaxID=1836956 RepID=A0AAD9APH5_9PEZI|nr:hypothetical protein CCHR01_06585 [Colletotrichum chrysophilum]
MSNVNSNTWSFNDLPVHPFCNLPGELQDEIYEVASAAEPDQPQIRFVNFREHRTHQPNCPPFSITPCPCKNAHYLTFHPLRRQDVANQTSWRQIIHVIESSTPDVHVASINHRSRDASDRFNVLNRFPQQQGNWSLTTVSTMTSAERAACRHTPKTFIGDPTRCRLQDLVLVHFPANQTMPVTWIGKPLFFDPLCGDLKAIAVTMDNWKDQAYSNYLGKWLKLMDDGRARSWKLLEQYGADNVADGNYPTDWVTTGQTPGYVPWYPWYPQRRLNYDMPSGNMHLRILYDIFTDVKELWLLDLDALDYNVNLNEILRYRNTYDTPPRLCRYCRYVHDGYPKVFGGVDAYEFMELRLCDTWFQRRFGIAFDATDFLDAQRQLSMDWSRDRDCHDRSWTRSQPVAKLLVPIPKMP